MRHLHFTLLRKRREERISDLPPYPTVKEKRMVMDQIAMANSPSLSWEWGGGWTTFHFTY